ncbi:MAG TPA: multidrug transporter subunit MdtA [Methylococcaceae bacterium]|nr:multidrug transporter subunit MdtA [Methylococcaceae bacterium]
MARFKQQSFFIIGFLLLTSIGLGAYKWPLFSAVSGVDAEKKSTPKHAHKHDDNTPTSVSVETSRQEDFPIYFHALGTVVPLRTVMVRPRVSGEIVSINFKEGQQVKEGDLLAQIDAHQIQIELQQAQGQLLRDTALLDNAKIDYARYQTLLLQDSIAAQQTATQAAQVKQYQGMVDMDTAQVNNAKLQLSYTKVVAPISGRLGLRQIDQGNLVQANESSLVTITQYQPIHVIFTLPEDQVQAVLQRQKNAMPIEVIAYDRQEKKALATGKLVAIDNQIDTATGTLKFKALFDNTDEMLFSNQFVTIKMHIETRKNITKLSTAAIQHDRQGAFIYVVRQDNTIELRRITLGETQGDKVIVLSHLDANESVVLEGIEVLYEGSKVSITQKDGEPIKN